MASEIPSINPMTSVRVPNTLLRNSGTSEVSISLEMSVKKLVRVTAQTFLGNDARRILGFLGSGSGIAGHAGVRASVAGSAPEASHRVIGDVVERLVEREMNAAEFADRLPSVAVTPPRTFQRSSCPVGRSRATGSRVDSRIRV